MKAFGPFGEVELRNVVDGIAMPVVIAATPDRFQELIHVPTSFSSTDELYDTAEARGHKISGFIASQHGAGFYTI